MIRLQLVVLSHHLDSTPPEGRDGEFTGPPGPVNHEGVGIEERICVLDLGQA